MRVGKFFFQFLPQSCASAVQPNFHCADRCVDEPADFPECQSVNIVHPDCLLLLRRQRGDSGMHDLVQFAEFVNCFRRRLQVSLGEVPGHASTMPLIRGMPVTSGTDSRSAEINDDTQQPGMKSFRNAQIVQSQERLQQSFLGYIFGFK